MPKNIKFSQILQAFTNVLALRVLLNCTSKYLYRYEFSFKQNSLNSTGTIEENSM